MDRKSYDSKAMGIFDTLGSYFVDAIYNNHYRIAKDLVRRGAANNITDAYRSTIINYMNGSGRDELFKIIVHKLHEFYQQNSGFSSILLSEFQNKVLSQFIPPEYYDDFADRHKDKTLKEIVVKSVNELGEIVLEPRMLRRIIDNHLDRSNVIMLQDRIVDIFILQREEYYAKFAREISKKNTGGLVDKEVLNKLKDAYVLEKRKCCELTADRERASNIIKQLLGKISTLEAECAKLRTLTLPTVAEVPIPPPTEQSQEYTSDDAKLYKLQQETIVKRALSKSSGPPKTPLEPAPSKPNEPTKANDTGPALGELISIPDVAPSEPTGLPNILLDDDPWLV